MKKLQFYVIREFIPPFLLSVGIFTFIMLLDKILDLLDMIVSKGVPIRTVAEVFFLLLPSIMAVVIPMAVLAGVLMAIGRMSGDLEVTAMKASGISIFALIRPLMITAMILCGLMIYFNNEVLPDANHFAKNLMLDIGQMKPSAKIIPGVFVEDIDNYRILVEGKDDITGELTDILIHENIPGNTPRTITAETGILEPVSANRFKLTLHDGEMHEMTDESEYRLIKFEVYSMQLTRSGELTRQERDNRGDRELSAAQMKSRVDSLQTEVNSLEDSLRVLSVEFIIREDSGITSTDGETSADPTDPRIGYNRSRNTLSTRASNMRMLLDRKLSYERSIYRFRVEIEKKYSIPFACLVFVLLAIPLALSTRRGSAAIALGVSLMVIVLYYFFLTWGEYYADRGMVSPFIAMWLPNMVFGALGIILTVRSLHEGNPIPLQSVTERFQIFRRLLSRSKHAHKPESDK